jgi:CRP-like cAMP-binding protein
MAALTDDTTTLADNLMLALAQAFPHSQHGTRVALTRAAGVRTFGAGESIIQQGDESSIALVLGGHVAIRRTTVDGRELIVRIVTRGSLTGFLTLAAQPAGGDAIALTPTPAAVWRGSEVRSLAAADPGFGVDILDNVLATFGEMVNRLDSLLYQDALRRVARVLDLHAGLFFSERPILTRAHLPTIVGTSREMTGRVLRILESRNVVARVGRNRLRLLDPEGLSAAADPDRARGTFSGTRSS